MEDNTGKTKTVEPIDRVLPKPQYILITDELALKSHGINLSPKTMRKYHHLGVYSNWIIKILGRIYISIADFENVIEAAKGKQNDRANRLKKLNN